MITPLQIAKDDRYRIPDAHDPISIVVIAEPLLSDGICELSETRIENRHEM